MAEVTITEALAELNTIAKRVAKKREFCKTYLLRPDQLKDPLAKDGGSPLLIQKEMQAIADLENRHISIRLAIQKANQETEVTVEKITKPLAEWLTWRKEIAPAQQRHLADLKMSIDTIRKQSLTRGAQVVQPGAENTKPTDIVVNVDEAKIASDAEFLETVLGGLDGQLSLKNATVVIEI